MPGAYPIHDCWSNRRHELKHPVKLRGSRRCVHSSEFQAEEKLYPHLDRAKDFLKHL
jgi:hypothetical protein